jgi:hypothetical protein
MGGLKTADCAGRCRPVSRTRAASRVSGRENGAGPGLQRSLTQGISAHGMIPLRFLACLRGQSAVISSDRSDNLASMP